MVDTSRWPSRMTMSRRVSVLVTWVWLCGSGVSSLTPFCTGGPGTMPSPSDPPLPDMSFQSFQAHVEVNLMDKGYTMDAEQYLDFDGNNGLIKFFANGMESRSIYSYNTGEIFKIDSESHCQVVNLTTSYEMNLFGDDFADGRSHIPPAAEALRFGSQRGPVFKGYSTTRGLPTLHWQTCMFWATTNTNFTLDHYFTASNWSTSSTHVMVPVRIEMQGEQTFTNGSTPRTFHHVYDYFDFRADSDVDSSVFQTPNNVECPGRVNTVDLPIMPTTYYYRQEIIDVADDLIMQADIWYNSDSKYLRVDHRPTSMSDSINTLNPITEIHDFNYGVRYVRDQVTGNCSVLPLVNGSFDDMMNTPAYKQNGSFTLQMKNPLQFFSLNSNYTFSGQRYARDALCDVYTSVRSDFRVPNSPGVNATFEYYFLSEGWSDDPNVGYSTYQTGFPFRLEITALDVGFHVVYNFLDFVADSPSLSVFDISDCFPDTKKLGFTVQFQLLGEAPKQFNRDKEDFLILKSHLTFMGAMDVNPIRIGRLRVEYDNTNVYVSATLVDRTPPAAQFTYVPKSEIERTDDMVWNNISDPITCAGLCVSNEAIVCRSFDFCPLDGYKCKLSKAHIGDGASVLKQSACDHFSRTVNPETAHEKTISEAYGDMADLVYQNQVQIDIPEDDGSTRTYGAIYTSIDFGYTDSKPLPSMPEQFSYRMEIVIPNKKTTTTVDVWYDSKYKLARYDTRDVTSPPPFYSPYTMTYVHDFNTGIAYNIDQVQGNCTITPISAATMQPDFKKDKAAFANNGAFVVQMKGPLEVFGLNYQYKYAGEKTARGILCDVFETAVPDFKLPTMNKTTKAIYQYYFQSSAWNMVADGSNDVTREQPIMAHVMAPEINLFMVYNIYDFDDEDPGMSVFDIKNCFGADQRHRFMVTFNKPFHPYLDTVQTLFERETLAMMSDDTFASPIRFQEPQLNYNLDSVSITVTLLGQADYILHFTKLQGPHPAHSTSKTITNISSPDDCAQACMMEGHFICNSFDICPSSRTCRLSREHVDDSMQPAEIGNDNQICTHYSRSVNGSMVEPAMLHVYDTIKDLVYKQLLQIPITYGSQTITYIATGVRDDIMRTNPPGVTEGEYLKNFKIYRNNVIYAHNDFVLHQMAVDDCATACSGESRFDCESFEYCYTTGDCMMSRLHPDNNQNLISNHSFCDLYAKSYLFDFNKYPGQVLLTPADKTLDSVNSPDMCANNCSTTTDFDCKSFDYCPNLKSCRLRKQHILEVPDTSVVASPMCDHYSRNYVYDFSKSSNSVISSHDDLVVADVTRDDCAKLCVEQSGFECQSFEFCGNTTDCRLSSVQPRSKPVSVVQDRFCDLFTRTLIKGTTPYDPNAATHYKYLSKPQDDSGAKAGLAVGMLILGVLLGVAALFFVLRLRGKKVDDMSVHFVNKENE
ncbi:uncharacterized protein LOC124133217 [Haliotis rufescens]|uniref:uncharacterized protein LOC124133217 n=1 Tax=Haliotis rufescens TaxID=6454 RepID=UPI00201F4B72|nr:uncharacterized protein LOC124133217 [Haliotis rufescens]